MKIQSSLLHIHLPSNLSSPRYTFTLPFFICLLSFPLTLFPASLLYSYFPSASHQLCFSSLISAFFIFLIVCLFLSLSLFLSFPSTLPYQTHLTLSLPLTVLISPLPSPLNLYHCLLLTPRIIRLLCPYLLHISLIPLSLPFHSSANLEEGFRTTRPSTRLIQHYYISQAISLSLYTSSIHATHY